VASAWTWCAPISTDRRHHRHQVGGRRGFKRHHQIPLTLAIVSALIVEAGRRPFAIPQLSVVELVRAGPTRASHRAHQGHRGLAAAHKLLPLMHLRSWLKIDDGPPPIPRTLHRGHPVGNQTFGTRGRRRVPHRGNRGQAMSTKLRHIDMFSGTPSWATRRHHDHRSQRHWPRRSAPRRGLHEIADETAGHSRPFRRALTSLLVFRAGSAQPKGGAACAGHRLEEIAAGQDRAQ